MKIKDLRPNSNGKQLSCFSPGNCVRLVSIDKADQHIFLGNLYLVVRGSDGAYNLEGGTNRIDGLFVLVNATVVVE